LPNFDVFVVIFEKSNQPLARVSKFFSSCFLNLVYLLSIVSCFLSTRLTALGPAIDMSIMSRKDKGRERLCHTQLREIILLHYHNTSATAPHSLIE
jgi:hypothetical protein